jgi:hypothetical protein
MIIASFLSYLLLRVWRVWTGVLHGDGGGLAENHLIAWQALSLI